MGPQPRPSDHPPPRGVLRLKKKPEPEETAEWGWREVLSDAVSGPNFEVAHRLAAFLRQPPPSLGRCLALCGRSGCCCGRWRRGGAGRPGRGGGGADPPPADGDAVQSAAQVVVCGLRRQRTATGRPGAGRLGRLSAQTISLCVPFGTFFVFCASVTPTFWSSVQNFKESNVMTDFLFVIINFFCLRGDPLGSAQFVDPPPASASLP